MRRGGVVKGRQRCSRGLEGKLDSEWWSTGTPAIWGCVVPSSVIACCHGYCRTCLALLYQDLSINLSDHTHTVKGITRRSGRRYDVSLCAAMSIVLKHCWAIAGCCNVSFTRVSTNVLNSTPYSEFYRTSLHKTRPIIQTARYYAHICFAMAWSVP